jgi:hypothetical protein
MLFGKVPKKYFKSFDDLSKEYDEFMMCSAWGFRSYSFDYGIKKVFHTIKGGWKPTVKNANKLIKMAYRQKEKGSKISEITVMHFDFKTGKMTEFE